MTCPRCKCSFDDAWWWCSECGEFPADGLSLQVHMIVPGYGVHCVLAPTEQPDGSWDTDLVLH